MPLHTNHESKNKYDQTQEERVSNTMALYPKFTFYPHPKMGLLGTCNSS